MLGHECEPQARRGELVSQPVSEGPSLATSTDSSLVSTSHSLDCLCGSPCKGSACNARDLGSILGWEDPLEKGRATHFSILA